MTTLHIVIAIVIALIVAIGVIHFCIFVLAETCLPEIVIYVLIAVVVVGAIVGTGLLCRFFL